MALTDQKIRSLKPLEKRFKCADERGLYIEVTPNGGRWWRLKYRFGGKEKRISLGTYPDTSLKEARVRRDAARNLLASGVDPSASRRLAQAESLKRQDSRFASVAHEYLAKISPRWSEAHRLRTTRLVERDILPWIGSLSIADINAPGLLEVARRIEARGALETAHRCLQVCSQIFRYAVATGRVHGDPTRDLRGALPPPEGGHFAATTEPQQFGLILRALSGYRGSPTVRTALRLAPLLFVRPGELQRAEWTDIDFQTAEWRFTVSKTKTKHIVPLSRQAVAAFRELQPLTGTGRFVFPSARSNLRPMSENAVLFAMRALGISKEEMSGHGFRAVARTILDEVHGIRPDFIEHQLAHAVRDPNGRAYNRTAHLQKRHEMMQLWADYLDDLVEKSSPPAYPSPAKDFQAWSV